MSSDWFIPAAAGMSIALATSHLRGGAAVGRGAATAEGLAAIPTFGAPQAGAGSVETSRRD